MKKLHSEWFDAREEYGRAVKLASNEQADKMNIASSTEVEAGLYFLLVRMKQAKSSKVLPHSASNSSITEDDLGAFDDSTTSVEDRKHIIQKHVGKHKSSDIAMASSKERL